MFGAIDQMGGKLLRTIGQARANFAMTMMVACYNLKRLVYFQKAGISRAIVPTRHTPPQNIVHLHSLTHPLFTAAESV